MVEMRRQIKGYTLIEIAICILIIGIIAAATVPVISSMTEDAQAETMRSIASDVEIWIGQGLSRGLTFDSVTSNTDMLDDIAANVQADYSGGDASITVVAAAGRQVDVALNTGGSAKTATLVINNAGKVNFTAVTGFSQYSVVNGDLRKS